MLKILFRICIALIVSLILTVVCVAYIPSVFTQTLDTGLELLPRHKFIDYKVQTKAELDKDFEFLNALETDKQRFEQLKQHFPKNRDKSLFFADMLVAHNYPQPCQFTIIGMHNTIDVSWQITGLRCDDPKSCRQALEHQICPKIREPKLESHR